MKECEKELLGGSVSSEKEQECDGDGPVGGNQNGVMVDSGFDFLGKRDEDQVFAGVIMNRDELGWLHRMAGCRKCKNTLESFVGNFGFGHELLN